MRRVALLVAFSLLLGVATPVAGDLQEELEEVGRRIDDLQAQVGAAESARSELAVEVSTSQSRMASLVAELAAAEEDLVAVATEIDGTEERLQTVRKDLDARYLAVDETRRSLEALRQQARTQAVEAYMAGTVAAGSVVLDTEHLMEVSISVAYADRAAEAVERVGKDLDALELELGRQAAAIAADEAELEAQVAELRAKRERLQELAEEVADRKQAVEAELAVQRSLLATVEREIEFFEGELATLAAEEARLKDLIRQAQSPAGTAPGILARPVPGPITSSYGPRVHPILGTTRLHAGVDFRGGYGQAIAAAGDGTVIYAAPFGGYGNTVIIDHGGGMATLYAHQSDLAVATGAVVASGQVVGYVGSTGLSTGPHLHFEVRIGGAPVDPAPYL